MSRAAVPPIDTLSTLPQPSHITLLFRHHKSAVFLSVSPNQPFSTVKQLLLSAMQARGISSLSSPTAPTNKPTPLPTEPDDIELGILIDKKDAAKGWTLLTPGSSSASGLSSKALKKKAAAAAPSSAKPDGDIDTPAGAGLTDGSWLAYRVKQGLEKEEPSVDENGDVDVEMNEDQGWDVVLPSFEEEEEEVGKEGGGDGEKMGD